VILRPAAFEELPGLQALEQRAGERFAAVGLGMVAEGANLPLEVLDAARLGGLLWVASDPDGPPFGFLAAQVTEAWLHVTELDVDPGCQNAGGDPPCWTLRWRNPFAEGWPD
jgi:hypothetical protein